ncbi:PaaI family thioesterase [Nocardia miyunensis]|uniref:PaaI family thioesterase n=1 Tax=Nocardia miyunensis TaxID=282684 RepID=UPI00082F2F17|nr:PaaI family thioesterase [Nocardia miyunensis]
MTDRAAAPPADTISVPWSVVPDYHCFGCSPHNSSGLGLRFTRHADGLQARFRLDHRFESYPGVVHGGLIGVICDEVMGNLIVLARQVPAFTVSQRTRFLTPLLIGRDYRCVATLSTDKAGTIGAAADILDQDDGLCASSSAVYRPFALTDVRHQLTLGDADVARLEHALSIPDAHFAPDAPPGSNPLHRNGVHP